MFPLILIDFLGIHSRKHILNKPLTKEYVIIEESLLLLLHVRTHTVVYTRIYVAVNKTTLFQVGKQFDALLVDSSAPVFDTVASNTRMVRKS